MSSFIKRIKLRWSDLCLFVWFVCGAIISFEQNRFTYYSDANLTTFNVPFYCCLALFILMVFSLFTYLYLEYKQGNYKHNLPLYLLAFIIITSHSITIFQAPNIISLSIFNVNDELFTVRAQFNEQVKALHFFKLFFAVASYFIGLFIFPKRINNLRLISCFFYLVYLLAIVFAIYSLINDDYINLFKAIFSNNPELRVKDYSPISVFGNPNPYGLFLEICFFISIVNYYLDHKKINIIVSLITFLHLVLTMCKAGIVSAVFSVFILLFTSVIISLIKKQKNRAIRYSIATFVYSSISVAAIFILSFTNKDTISFNEIITFSYRNYGWYTSIQLINNSSYVYGMGFGIYNTLMASSWIHYSVENLSISHNSFLALMGAGGLINVIPYTLFLIYTCYVIIKNIKNPVVIAIGCTTLSLFIHSLLEDTYYIVIACSVLLLTYLNAYKEKDLIKNTHYSTF